jgi:hypothetical protein
MRIILKGKRVLFEPAARAFDTEAELEGEFQRKARTLAGNFQLVQQLPQALHPIRNRVLWQFASHKLARLVCPYALMSLLAANAVLVVTAVPGWPWFTVCLGAQLGGYGLAAVATLRGARAGRLERVAHTFVVLNAAAVEGLRRFLTGRLRWTNADGSG